MVLKTVRGTNESPRPQAPCSRSGVSCRPPNARRPLGESLAHCAPCHSKLRYGRRTSASWPPRSLSPARRHGQGATSERDTVRVNRFHVNQRVVIDELLFLRAIRAFNVGDDFALCDSDLKWAVKLFSLLLQGFHQPPVTVQMLWGAAVVDNAKTVLGLIRVLLARRRPNILQHGQTQRLVVNQFDPIPADWSVLAHPFFSRKSHHVPPAPLARLAPGRLLASWSHIQSCLAFRNAPNAASLASTEVGWHAFVFLSKRTMSFMRGCPSCISRTATS